MSLTPSWWLLCFSSALERCESKHCTVQQTLGFHEYMAPRRQLSRQNFEGSGGIELSALKLLKFP
jgi:hypothetical protein